MHRPGPAAGSSSGNRKNRFPGPGLCPASSIFLGKQLPGGLRDPRSKGDRVQPRTQPVHTVQFYAVAGLGAVSLPGAESIPAPVRPADSPGGARRLLGVAVPSRRPSSPPGRAGPLQTPGQRSPGPESHAHRRRVPRAWERRRPRPAWLRTPRSGGGRAGGLWVDAGAAPSPGTDASPPATRHPLGDTAQLCGQRVRSRYCAGRGGRDRPPPGRAEDTASLSPAGSVCGQIGGDAQVLQGSLGAGVVPVAAHRRTFTPTRGLHCAAPQATSPLEGPA